MTGFFYMFNRDYNISLLPLYLFTFALALIPRKEFVPPVKGLKSRDARSAKILVPRRLPSGGGQHSYSGGSVE